MSDTVFAIRYLILVFNSGCQKYFVIQYFDTSSIDIISFIYNVKLFDIICIQRYLESMKRKKEDNSVNKFTNI